MSTALRSPLLPPKIKEQNRKVIVELSARLLSRAIKTEEGTCWEVEIPGYAGATQQEQAPGLAYGTAGIVLALVAVEQHLPDPERRAILLDAARWLADSTAKGPTEDYSLFAGRMGVVKALLAVYRLTREEQWLQAAQQITEPITEQYLGSEYLDDSLSRGASGALGVLSELFLLSPTEANRSRVEQFAHRLIKRVISSDKGLYWADSGRNIQPLLGLFEGSTGPLLYAQWLAETFQAGGWDWLQQQATNHQNAQIDTTTGNWPDYRKEITTGAQHKSYLERYKAMERHFFTKPADDSSLAHGTAGLLLSRLSAKADPQDYERAIAHLRQISPGEIAHLAEGSAGISFVLATAGKKAGDTELIDHAITLVQHAIKQAKHLDVGLLYGQAGIMLACLQLAVEEQITLPFLISPGIEAPALPEANGQIGSLLGAPTLFMQQLCYQHAYRNTTEMIHARQPEVFTAFEQQLEPHTPVLTQFARYMQQALEAGQLEPAAQCAELLKLDETRLRLRNERGSGALYYLREVCAHEEAEEVLNQPDDRILQFRYTLNPDYEALELEWDWFTVFDEEERKPVNRSRNFELEADYFIVLLSQNSSRQGVQEAPLNDLSIVLYSCMQGSMTGYALITAALDYLEVPYDESTNELKALITDQIKEFIGSGVLQLDPA